MNIKKDINFLQAVKDGEIKIKTSRIEECFSASLFTKGNSKLNKSIWTFSYNSGTNCISDKLGLCGMSDICYAKASENLFHNADCYDGVNKSYFHLTSAKNMASYLIQKNRNARKHHLEVLRLNVSGDILKKEDIRKFDLLARYLREVLDVPTYLYTKRLDLLPSLRKARYLHINLSQAFVNGFSSYIALDKEEMEEALTFGIIDTVCHCEDCLNCRKCIEGNNLKIGCLIH